MKVFSKPAYYAETGYVPHEGQRLIHNDNHRFRVISNGRRYGKTILGSKEVEPCAFVESRHISGGPQLGWIVGPQYTDAEKEFKLVYDQFRKLGIDKDAIKWQNNADSGSLHIKTSWGFELIGKSAKHPETLVGEGLDFVLMVEAGRHKRRTWGQYIRPTLSDKRGWTIFSGVPEGRSEHSLLYSLWGRGQDPAFKTWSSYRMPSWANTITFPGGRRDPEILEAEADLTEDEFNRQYGAMFVDKVGSVMQEWDDEIHLRSLQYNPDWPLYMAVDYGFTNPFVVLWIQVDPWDNVYVIGERRWTGVDTLDVTKDLAETQPNLVRACVAIYPDPAEPDDTYTMSNKLRIPARGNTGGELRTRLSLIRRHLKIPQDLSHLPDGHQDKKPRTVVDRSCAMLAWEMREGYRWPEHRSEVHSQSENPLDKDNHGPEALGRFFKGYFGLSGRSGSRSTKAKVG
jgi:hypothetical protein